MTIAGISRRLGSVAGESAVLEVAHFTLAFDHDGINGAPWPAARRWMPAPVSVGQ